MEAVFNEVVAASRSLMDPFFFGAFVVTALLLATGVAARLLTVVQDATFSRRNT